MGGEQAAVEQLFLCITISRGDSYTVEERRPVQCNFLLSQFPRETSMEAMRRYAALLMVTLFLED